VVNLADCLVELLQGGVGHSFEAEVVPVKYVHVCRIYVIVLTV